uniref:Sodium/calcium exchanger membrane region domain-containing protein n=1 Tax=Panagrolaimus sp. ES5 TaxID=591445 RepID=A0AC34F1L9_9BILA
MPKITELKADALSMNSNGAVLQPPKQSVSIHDSYPHIDDTENEDDAEDPEDEEGRSRRHTIASHYIDSTSKFNSPINVMMEPMNSNARNSQASNFMIPSIVISPSNPLDGNEAKFKYHNGKFHYSEKEFDSESDDASDIVVVPATHPGRRFTILSLNEARMSMQVDHMPTVSPDEPITTKRIFKDLITALNPIEEDFSECKWYSKILQVMKFPLIVVLRLTVPQAMVWCKTLSLIQCITMPITILGLTVMAWCNSIGDLVADISVAKQGFPQMAASAAIGGPLFNLLVGFGAAFFIATLQGKHVDISIDSVKALLLISVAGSLLVTLVILIITKFHATRVHGIILIVLYVVLLIGVILADLKVFDF